MPGDILVTRYWGCKCHLTVLGFVQYLCGPWVSADVWEGASLLVTPSDSGQMGHGGEYWRANELGSSLTPHCSTAVRDEDWEPVSREQTVAVGYLQSAS